MANWRKLMVLGVLAGLLVALPSLAMWLDEPFLITFASRTLIFALAAVSLDLILGYGGLVSFGHAAFLGFGAYVSGIGVFHVQDYSAFLGWLPGSEQALILWPLSVLGAALLAAAIGAVSLRTSGVYFIMITLAFAQMMFYLFVSLSRYGGEDGIALWQRNQFPGVDLNDDASFYYVVLALLVGFVLLAQRLVNARFGMVLRGCKQNERRLQALGVASFRYQWVAFILAGAGAGLAGALMTNQNEFVSPALLSWHTSGELMIMVILGGMGTLYGPIVGAIVLLSLEEILNLYTDHWALWLGPILLGVVLFARRGVYGMLTGEAGRDG